MAAARESQTDAKVLEVEFPLLIVSIRVHHVVCLSEIGANARHTTVGGHARSRRERAVAVKREGLTRQKSPIGRAGIDPSPA